MTTSPFGQWPGAQDQALDDPTGPFEAAALSPFGGAPASPFGGAPASPFGGAAASPFGGAPDAYAGGSSTAVDGGDPSRVHGEAADPSDAPWEVSFAEPTATGPAVAPMAPFGSPTAGEHAAPAFVPTPRRAHHDETDQAPALPTRPRGERRRVSPLIAVAIAGGAVLAGALGAFVLLGSTGGDDTGAITAEPPVSTARPSSAASAADGTGGASPSPSATATSAFTPNARDPFAALVTAGGTAPATAAGTAPVLTGEGTSSGSTGLGSTGLGSTGLGSTAGGTSGSSGSAVGAGQVSTGGASSGASATPTPAATALTKAQVCTAVTDPMNQVEQLLTSSASGTTGAVDAGLALRNPVAVLRTAVSLTSDSRLAGRLDIAASTAEALRAQLVAGTAVTSGQVATQVSRDADVRSACA